MQSYSSRVRDLVYLMLLITCGLAAGADTNTVAPKPGDNRIKDSNGIAATVDGVDITEAELDAEVTVQLGRMKVPAQLPASFLEQYRAQLRQQVLEGLIVERLLDEQVKAAGIVITDQDVIAHLKDSGARQEPPLSLEDIRALVEAQGQSFDELKSQLRQSKGMRYQKLMEGQWAGKISITEEDAKKYYSENKKRFETPEQVRASHILITPDIADPNTDPNQARAKARAKAEELLKQLKSNTADFAALAKANSAHAPSAERGGDLGFISRGQAAPPAFEKAAFELKPGQVSDVVETQYGYHIITVTDRKDPNVITFEQAKADIMNMLVQEKQRELAEKYIESLKAKAKIAYPAGKEPEPNRQPGVFGRPAAEPE
ncbi:MAG TPA: peptidylprolyl isomerase [Sedimentisphaerales bacterium]|nr:peptidylprolyl isomerase [Sedimentisphaerales bacterium]